MWKRIIVLANSVKHEPGRCIAGREFFSNSGSLEVGSWIRPVSRIGEGQLYPRNFTFADGNVPHIFDVVDVPIEAEDADPTQPENLIVSEEYLWKRVISGEDIKQSAVSDFQNLIEFPRNLWLQPMVKTDRVTKEFLAANPPSQSLYLIELHNATINRNERRHRLHFSLNGASYDLAITDPLITHITGTESSTVIRKGLACVSLAPAFLNKYDGKEYHYKLAAMVVKND